MPFHHEKKLSQMVELAAKFFAREASNMSLMTITSARVTDDEERATICFTVLPESQEEAALEFAKRKRSDFRDFVKKESRFNKIPYFDFAIDIGEKNRQLIDKFTN